MSELAAEFTGMSGLPLQIVVLRLAGAALLCGVIGFEREMSDHPAGLRTNMLVGLAAATFALITLHLVTTFELITLHLVTTFEDRSDVIRLDPIRLVEAVTSGVAFLAAGMIFVNQGKVKGLTTGAAMWCAAAVGLCAGLGMWIVAALTAVLAFVITHILKRLSGPIRSE